MKINVGSKNVTKVQSIKDAVLLYPNIFPNAEVVGVDVNVELFGHPKTLKETTEGAKQRALEAFKDCDYSFGLEGGLMESPETLTGYAEVNVCIIYDGKRMYPGFSPFFEWPPEVTKFILEGKGDASQAFKKLGYTDHDKLGNQPGGIIGYLTQQRTTREQFMLESIKMAMIHLEFPNLYRRLN